MKNLTWVIIGAVILIGGYVYTSNQSAKDKVRIDAAETARAVAVAAAAESATAVEALTAEVTAANAATADANAKLAVASVATVDEATKAAEEAVAAEEASGAANLPPFATPGAVGYAKLIWASMDAQNLAAGPQAIHSSYYQGTQPHGSVLETFFTKATIRGHTGELIVKRNYGPAGVSVADVMKAPEMHLGAITIMFRREDGYDDENNNWFWAKYNKDGSVSKNPKGMALAGRVAKGMDQGCIACHSGADGEDFTFVQDHAFE